jgi:hypothetical protein
VVLPQKGGQDLAGDEARSHFKPVFKLVPVAYLLPRLLFTLYYFVMYRMMMPKVNYLKLDGD